MHDPANARIILVEPFSKEGRYFVREWQAEAGKSVLDIAWATASVESGRALLQEDQYGGFGNLSGENIKDDDDGLAGAGRNAEDLDDEELDIVEVEKSVTPVKSKRKRGEGSLVRCRLGLGVFGKSNELERCLNNNSFNSNITGLHSVAFACFLIPRLDWQV